MEKIVVEEMAKRTVPDIVHQGRDPQELFHIIGRRDVFSRFLEEGIQMSGESSRHVHRPQGMDEAGMLGRRIDPTGALELINVPEALDPRGIDQIFFGELVRIRSRVRNGEGDILVNRISDQG